MTLTAALRPSFRSSARYTSPMPPSPRRSTIRYCAIVRPIIAPMPSVAFATLEPDEGTITQDEGTVHRRRSLASIARAHNTSTVSRVPGFSKVPASEGGGEFRRFPGGRRSCEKNMLSAFISTTFMWSRRSTTTPAEALCSSFFRSDCRIPRHSPRCGHYSSQVPEAEHVQPCQTALWELRPHPDHNACSAIRRCSFSLAGSP